MWHPVVFTSQHGSLPIPSPFNVLFPSYPARTPTTLPAIPSTSHTSHPPTIVLFITQAESKCSTPNVDSRAPAALDASLAARIHNAHDPRILLLGSIGGALWFCWDHPSEVLNLKHRLSTAFSEVGSTTLSHKELQETATAYSKQMIVDVLHDEAMQRETQRFLLDIISREAVLEALSVLLRDLCGSAPSSCRALPSSAPDSRASELRALAASSPSSPRAPFRRSSC